NVHRSIQLRCSGRAFRSGTLLLAHVFGSLKPPIQKKNVLDVLNIDPILEYVNQFPPFFESSRNGFVVGLKNIVDKQVRNGAPGRSGCDSRKVSSTVTSTLSPCVDPLRGHL